MGWRRHSVVPAPEAAAAWAMPVFVQVSLQDLPPCGRAPPGLSVITAVPRLRHQLAAAAATAGWCRCRLLGGAVWEQAGLEQDAPPAGRSAPSARGHRPHAVCLRLSVVRTGGQIDLVASMKPPPRNPNSVQYTRRGAVKWRGGGPGPGRRKRSSAGWPPCPAPQPPDGPGIEQQVALLPAQEAWHAEIAATRGQLPSRWGGVAR